MSFEVSSTASNSSTFSTSGVDPIPVDHTQSPFSCLHELVDNRLTTLRVLKSSSDLVRSQESASNAAENMVCEGFTILYLNNIRGLCDKLINEVELGVEVNSLACDGYLTSIEKANCKQVPLNKEIEELDKIFKEHLNTIQPEFSQEAAESFKTRVSALIGDYKNYSHKKTDMLVETALTEFYNSNLDSYPNLHPGFGGSYQKAIAQHYSQDIVDFLDENSEMDTQYREVLLECSAKLQEAFDFEIKREKSIVKKWMNNALEDCAKAMEGKIKNLKVGESCIFLGGTGCHGVIYEVIQKSKDSCEFTIINTGDDEPSFFFRKPAIGDFFMSPTKFGHKSYVVNTATLESNFLLTLLQLKEERGPMKDVIKEIDQHFKTKSQLGRMHHSQKRGSCAAKSVASWVKGELIRKLGEKKGTALYLQLKHGRAEKSHDTILKLKQEVPIAHFQNAYSTRTYKPRKTRYEEKKILTSVPATESQVKQYWKELDTAAAQVIRTWSEKAKKAEPNLSEVNQTSSDKQPVSEVVINFFYRQIQRIFTMLSHPFIFRY